MRCILPLAPFDFINLFFNFERFQVVEFGFVGLEFGMELIFAGFFLSTSVLNGRICSMDNDGGLYHTVSFLSNNTTRPPLSPVAR